MAVKSINSEKCRVCSRRDASGCAVYDVCPMDVWRLDEEGKPFMAYQGDCQTCLLCVRDCPEGAVYVSAVVDFPILPY